MNAMSTINNREARFLGAMFGLAYGDSIGLPALFHRFTAVNPRRHVFLWRTNAEQSQAHIARLTLPYTHRDPATTLEPAFTDDTEWALLILRTLLNAEGEPTRATFLSLWQDELIPARETLQLNFSAYSAMENFKQGLLPPATGNDNPIHYEDSAVARAVPIGLYCAGNPSRAAELAAFDAEITQAEDGIYAAKSMAAAIAVLADGGPLADGLAAAYRELPAGSWIAHNADLARACIAEAEVPQAVALLLNKRLINTVYTYGSVAPETFPAALALVEACNGDLLTACLLANTMPKAADSLPAMVGALCGAYQGIDAISPVWRQQLTLCRGVCLPFLKGVSLWEETLELAERVS